MKQAVYGPQVRRAGSGGDTSSVRRTNFEQTQAFHWLVRLVRSRVLLMEG
jgi:hypothetical protein